MGLPTVNLIVKFMKHFRITYGNYFMKALLRQDNKTIKLLNHWIQINTDEILRDFFKSEYFNTHILMTFCPVLAVAVAVETHQYLSLTASRMGHTTDSCNQVNIFWNLPWTPVTSNTFSRLLLSHSPGKLALHFRFAGSRFCFSSWNVLTFRHHVTTVVEQIYNWLGDFVVVYLFKRICYVCYNLRLRFCAFILFNYVYASKLH